MMDLLAIVRGLSAELERIPGLNASPGPPEAANIPAAIVDFDAPAAEYYKAFSGGAVQINLIVTVLVGRGDVAMTQQALNEFASAGIGADRSVFDVITTGADGMANTWGGTIESCIVTGVRFEDFATAGIDSLGAVFTIEAYCNRK